MELDNNVWKYQAQHEVSLMSMKKTNEMFVAEMAMVAPDIEVVGEYVGARHPIKVRCKKCGHTWNPWATNLLQRGSCPACGKMRGGEKRRLSKDEFENKLKDKNPDIEIIGEYEKASTKVFARCKRCGYEWLVLPSKLLGGTGCPECNHSGTSFVEQVICLSLQSITGEEVLSRNRSVIDKELDIFIPSKLFAVEYGSWFWHKGKEDVDNGKIKQCSDKGIKLIEIFDSYNGERQSTENIWLYKKNLSKAENISIVKKLIIKLCEEIGVQYSLSDEEFEKIRYQARINSRRITTDILNEKLEQIQADIVVISEFQEMLTKVSAKCKICGHEWAVTPANLLNGKRCPKCRGKRISQTKLKKTEQYVAELKERNSNIEVLSEYTGSKKHITVRCKKHDYVWSCFPGSLLKGAGCYKCASEKIHETRAKTQDQFIKQIAETNPGIEIIGQYYNDNTKVKARCGVCLHEWEVRPGVLVRGGGCPKCGYKSAQEKQRKTNEQFISELKDKNTNVIPLDKYINATTKIRFQCKICSHIWEAIPYSLLSGHGCPKCSRIRKTQDVFLEEMQVRQPTIEVVGSYVNYKTKVAVKCKICGYEWSDTPTNLLSLGRGCRQCRGKSKSLNASKMHKV